MIKKIDFLYKNMYDQALESSCLACDTLQGRFKFLLEERFLCFVAVALRSCLCR